MYNCSVSHHSRVALRQLAEVEQSPVDMYTVYVIYNQQHDKIYIGQTESLAERLVQHKNKLLGDKSYTARFDGGWAVIYTEQVASRVLAIQRERQLKSYRGRQFVREFIPV
ncbi:MAG: GIY-YIG catalytic domain protein [candidate division Kazan bacterium GW2011_GWB1_52_7]|uniref:GIY-YIG catalytic domain protein n=2 Tax=Bacteria division Kazan-3B-28 TaxID=1798534 RepID=A0A0G1X8D0_UNCK3|nr:MAG: GIY-YIG catalytic domain protein [candidate division Kazan bacterium GW2011_GWB1_52_7]